MCKENHHKVVILGSGPAGLTSAIYTGRALLEPMVLEGLQPGGQLMITSEVENFPGFENGISGPELMANMRRQAERFGAKFITNIAEKADLSERPFKIIVDEKMLTADALIIATGASARKLGLDSEKKYSGKGVSYCATCDGFFFRDKEIVVIGGGDSALEDALFLTRFAKKVSIIHRRDRFRASMIMQERAFSNEKIDILFDFVLDEILGNDSDTAVGGVRLRNVKSDRMTELSCEGVFIAIGHEPNTKIFRDYIDMDEFGYIKLYKGCRTNVQGVFAAGDVHDPIYRQAITAAGCGCRAALDAEKFLLLGD